MEWTIHIDQDLFADWPTEVDGQLIKIDIIDAAIVKGIWQYQNPEFAPKLERDYDGYVWLDHKHFCRVQFPLLGLKEDGLRKRLKSLCFNGLLDKHLHKIPTENGPRWRAFYRTTKAFGALFQYKREQRDALSNKELDAAGRQHELFFLESKRPDIPAMIQDHRKTLEHYESRGKHRDNKGRFKGPVGQPSDRPVGQKSATVSDNRPTYSSSGYPPSKEESSICGEDASAKPRNVDNSQRSFELLSQLDPDDRELLINAQREIDRRRRKEVENERQNHRGSEAAFFHDVG